MNLNPMPCSATAAELAYDRAGQQAEEQHEAMAARYPLDDFETDAWKAALDGEELLHYLVDECPATVLNVILHDTNTTPDWLNSDPLESSYRLSRLIKIWIDDQKERFQEEAIEDARWDEFQQY